MAAGYTNASTYLVMCIVHALNLTDGVVRVWENPALNATPPDDSVAIITDTALTNFAFNNVAWYANGRTYADAVSTNYGLTPGAQLDEFRFAESWQELIAVPEPALALLALALAALCARRSC
jgi:hypothetical protein